MAKKSHLNNQEQQYKEYKCSLCGEIHERNHVCPYILKKMQGFLVEKKRNHLFGNIFLQCIKENINMWDILYEISCYQEAYCKLPWDRSINAELMMEYYAHSLNCSPKNFVRNPEKTIDDLCELLGDPTEIEDVRRNEDGKVDYIRLSTEIELPDFLYARRFEETCKIYYVKERIDENEWSYAIEMECPTIVINGSDQRVHVYSLMSMGVAYTSSIRLAEAYSGKLKAVIDEYVDTEWYECSDNVKNDWKWISLWVNKLKMATERNLLSWTELNKNHYQTRYEEKYIDLHLHHVIGHLNIMDNKRFDEVSHRLSIRFEDNRSVSIILEENPENEKTIEDMRTLCEIAANAVDKAPQLIEDAGIKSIRIKETDALVVTSSMLCKREGHSIIPYKGVISLLKEDGQIIEYEIYVGYCKQCDIYMIFEIDYDKMLECGVPLCRVYYYDDFISEKGKKPFLYQYQSLLAKKGYTVQANSSLSEKERQDIIKTILDREEATPNDLLEHFNWLIRTRRPMPQYKNAINRWKRDMEFTEQYDKNREKIQIKSLTVKAHRDDLKSKQ